MQRTRDLRILSLEEDGKTLPLELREHCGRASRDRATKGTKLLNQHGKSSYELSETETACTGPARSAQVLCAPELRLWLPVHVFM